MREVVVKERAVRHRVEGRPMTCFSVLSFSCAARRCVVPGAPSCKGMIATCCRIGSARFSRSLEQQTASTPKAKMSQSVIPRWGVVREARRPHYEEKTLIIYSRRLGIEGSSRRYTLIKLQTCNVPNLRELDIRRHRTQLDCLSS